MAYTVKHFDGIRSIKVYDQTVNADTNLQLLGKNFYGYGEIIAENFLHLTEHFSGTTQPDVSKAVNGQLWFKSDEKLFYVFNNGAWHPLDVKGAKTISVMDIAGVSHEVTAIFDGNASPVSIYSDAEFTVNQSETVIQPLFNVIYKGVTVSSDSMFHGTATSAQYSDLAEMYSSDADYEPGTVVKIGGEKEVTQTTEEFDPNVFGIVSTNPAHLMNSNIEGQAVAVALEGRVPCKVIGPVKKGDRLVASYTPGVARVPSDYERQEAWDWYRIVGRALEDKTIEAVGLVEVIVGAK
jgi:hypothetical protein